MTRLKITEKTNSSEIRILIDLKKQLFQLPPTAFLLNLNIKSKNELHFPTMESSFTW
jgi:hypothetical protein